ncbi:MAG TPA: hypothetical protein VHV31_12750, partial [Nitrolancea sp.]|nr:hypothetical protein [Nitrolancea sp.]
MHTGFSGWLSYLVLSVILGAGLALRLLLTPYGVYEGDAQTFRQWAAQMMRAPLTHFYSSLPTADHLPGDLWFLWGIAHLYHIFSPSLNLQSFGFLFLLKLVPSIADTLIGLMLFVIARNFAGPRAGLLGAALFMFNPASIFLSATWGQWDSVSAAFMLVGLWLVFRGSPEWSLPFLTYASLIKPQLALLIAVAAIVWWRWFVQPRRDDDAAMRGRWHGRIGRLVTSALVSFAIFLAVDLPFGVGLPLFPTRWTIFGRATDALDRYTSISANAFNIWGVFGQSSNMNSVTDSKIFFVGLSYQTWGTLLLAIAVCIALALLWIRPTREMALWAALAITFALFMLPTRIHERYLMPAVVLAVLVAAISPALRWVGIALSLTYFANIFF